MKRQNKDLENYFKEGDRVLYNNCLCKINQIDAYGNIEIEFHGIYKLVENNNDLIKVHNTSYIENPKTKAEHHHNIVLQNHNVIVLVNKNEYEAAIFSAEILIKKIKEVAKLKF